MEYFEGYSILMSIIYDDFDSLKQEYADNFANDLTEPNFLYDSRNYHNYENIFENFLQNNSYYHNDENAPYYENVMNIQNTNRNMQKFLNEEYADSSYYKYAYDDSFYKYAYDLQNKNVYDSDIFFKNYSENYTSAFDNRYEYFSFPSASNAQNDYLYNNVYEAHSENMDIINRSSYENISNTANSHYNKNYGFNNENIHNSASSGIINNAYDAQTLENISSYYDNQMLEDNYSVYDNQMLEDNYGIYDNQTLGNIYNSYDNQESGNINNIYGSGAGGSISELYSTSYGDYSNIENGLKNYSDIYNAENNKNISVSPNINISFGDVHQNSDINDIADMLARLITEEITAGAEGLHY